MALGVICDLGLWTARLPAEKFLCVRRGISSNNTQHSDQSRIGFLELGLQGSVSMLLEMTPNNQILFLVQSIVVASRVSVHSNGH